MKKKVLTLTLCVAMLMASITGCGKENPEASAAPTAAPTATEEGNNAVEAAAVPQDYTYYYSFDAKDDKESIQATQQVIGGDPILSPIEKDKKYIPGVKGDSLYVDGVTGYKLTDVNGVGDTYTVSFWLYPTRFANYMPTVQFGPDVHGDLTGGQKYVNITRADWSGEGTFPCIWSYDQADNALWPSWSDADTGEMMKQWIHLALVVDPSNVSADGLTIDGKLYINGQEWLQKDGDGNVIYPGIVKGAMGASDGFDFLVGVNYWDSVFKGAFDELYIYNYALDAAQIAGLYADGNPSVAYEEPERIIEVKKNDKAIASIGALDFSEAEAVYDAVAALEDGHTVQYKLKHWSDGLDTKDNYYFSFVNAEGAEVARVNADMTGNVGGTDIDAKAFTYNWGNWNTWMKSVMVETEVTATFTRDGDTITVAIDNVDYNKTSNTCGVTFSAADVAGIKLGTVKSYTDILSVKDTTPAAGGIVVGNTDRSTPWWSAFSDIFAIPEGKSVTKSFTNYTSGVENWHNFVAILQNTPTGHSADTEGYAEYAVVRADNYGWGAGYDGIATATCDWNFDTFKEDMDGAVIDVTITNNGTTADINIVATTAAGKVYHQDYTGIAITGDLYACFSCESAYLSFDTQTVGALDRSTGWWTAFSDIWSVAEGESKTVYFKNFTSGVENWHNFVAILQNVPGGHSAEAYEGYKEYAVVRADNYGWGAGYDGIVTPESNWDFGTFKEDMDGAYIALTVTNNGATADINFTATTTAGKVFYQNYNGIAIDGDLYFCLGMEQSYLQIECKNLGKSDCSAGWWTTFSDIKAVAEGETVTQSFTNYTSGEENWHNFVVILQNTPTGHSAETTEGYAEYAVVRADNYGWGTGYDGIVTPESNWDFGTFKEDMAGAHIVLNVTNNGSTADIEIIATTVAGKVYTQKYEGIAVSGDVYYCLGLERAYLGMD